LKIRNTKKQNLNADSQVVLAFNQRQSLKVAMSKENRDQPAIGPQMQCS